MVISVARGNLGTGDAVDWALTCWDATSSAKAGDSRASTGHCPKMPETKSTRNGAECALQSVPMDRQKQREKLL